MSKTIKYLKDYTPTNYLVNTVGLTFIVNEDKTVQVNSITTYYKNPAGSGNTLVLDGDAKLISLALDNHELNAWDFMLQAIT